MTTQWGFYVVALIVLMIAIRIETRKQRDEREEKPGDERR